MLTVVRSERRGWRKRHVHVVCRCDCGTSILIARYEVPLYTCCGCTRPGRGRPHIRVAPVSRIGTKADVLTDLVDN